MKILGAIALWFAIAFVAACIASACVMMGINSMHDWWNFIPTITFWPAFDITVWFIVPLVLYTGGKSTSKS